MTLTVLRLSAQEHDEFVRAHPNGHLMQMSAWGREKEHTGWTWQTVAVGHPAGGERTTPEVTGVALILFRRTPVLPMALAYVPRGVVADWSDSATLDILLAEVSRVAKANRGVLLRLDPAIDITDPHARSALESRGFTRTDPGDNPAKNLAQPATRMITDISDLEDLHARLAKGTRWSIRKAERSGVVYESVGREQIPIFHDLLRDTAERGGFTTRSLEYFTTLMDVLGPTDEIIVSLVRLDPAVALASAQKIRDDLSTQLDKARAKPESEKRNRQIDSLETELASAQNSVAEVEALQQADPDGPYLAGSVFAINGTRGSYLYAASSDEHRNVYPSYLMVWNLMQKAAERGVTSFDFGGIDAADGLEEFKRKWEPERREYIGEFSKRLRPLTGRLIELAVSLYKRR
ncbi:MAG: peptidoglycan bridge formation glycyltransferase FemA/FemB family protein [Actinomycetia bacterium]|nr:peptidoglycan bridge formation glycyltransferase FemA/FemB family protein [Actinomycetes bacterium]